MKLPMIVLLSAIFLTGCSSLIPSEHKEQVAVRTAGELAATHATEFSRVVKDEAPPTSLSVSGSENKIDFHVIPAQKTVSATETGTLDSSGKDSAMGSSITSIPLGVKLCLVGLGIAIIWWVIGMIRKGSKAADAAWTYGDELVGRLINQKKLEAMSTTDPTQLARLNAELSHLNEERGKLNAA